MAKRLVVSATPSVIKQNSRISYRHPRAYHSWVVFDIPNKFCWINTKSGVCSELCSSLIRHRCLFTRVGFFII